MAMADKSSDPALGNSSESFSQKADTGVDLSLPAPDRLVPIRSGYQPPQTILEKDTVMTRAEGTSEPMVSTSTVTYTSCPVVSHLGHDSVDPAAPVDVTPDADVSGSPAAAARSTRSRKPPKVYVPEDGTRK